MFNVYDNKTFDAWYRTHKKVCYFGNLRQNEDTQAKREYFRYHGTSTSFEYNFWTQRAAACSLFFIIFYSSHLFSFNKQGDLRQFCVHRSNILLKQVSKSLYCCCCTCVY